MEKQICDDCHKKIVELCGHEIEVYTTPGLQQECSICGQCKQCYPTMVPNNFLRMPDTRTATFIEKIINLFNGVPIWWLKRK